MLGFRLEHRIGHSIVAQTAETLMTETTVSRGHAFLSRREIAVRTAIVALFVLALAFLWYSLYVLLLIFTGVLFAVLLHAVASPAARVTGLSYRLALACTIATLLAVVVGVGWYVLPQVASQIDQLQEQLPRALGALEQELRRYHWPTALLEANYLSGLDQFPRQLVSRVTTVLSSTIGALFSVLVVVISALYLAAQPRTYTAGLLHLLPLSYRPRGAEVIVAVGYTLRWWLLGRLISMVLVGVLTGLGLWWLDIPLALTLAIIAAFLDFIPNFGPIIAAVPAVLLALMKDPTSALWVVLLYTAVQQFEGLLITPLIQRRTVLLPPVLTIMAQVLFSLMAGVLGLLLATPLCAVGFVLVKMLYVEDVLGDEVDTPDDHMGTDQRDRLLRDTEGPAVH